MTLKSRLPARYTYPLVKLKNTLWGHFRKTYYSQGGEDIVLRHLFRKQDAGFYVDVGAFHPQQFSNTQLLYERGWNGINIDPNPENMRSFRRLRKRDINLQMGISSKQHTLTYYHFSKPALNTFSKTVADRIIDGNRAELINTIEVPCKPLRDVLSESLPKNTEIDLMNVDVEGFDLEVIESNDWDRFHPRVIIVEDHTYDPDSSDQSSVYRYLRVKGYRLRAFTGMSLIFESSDNS